VKIVETRQLIVILLSDHDKHLPNRWTFHKNIFFPNKIYVLNVNAAVFQKGSYLISQISNSR